MYYTNTPFRFRSAFTYHICITLPLFASTYLSILKMLVKSSPHKNTKKATQQLRTFQAYCLCNCRTITVLTGSFGTAVLATGAARAPRVVSVKGNWPVAGRRARRVAARAAPAPARWRPTRACCATGCWCCCWNQPANGNYQLFTD